MVKNTKKTRIPVHASIREALGYDLALSDVEIYEDWEERKRRVCKPCWELRYCPYGPFVEQSPLLPLAKQERIDHNEYLISCLELGIIGQVSELSEDDRAMYRRWADDEDLLVQQAYNDLRNSERLAIAATQSDSEDLVKNLLGGPLPPPHIYRVRFDLMNAEISEEQFSPEVWREILDKADVLRRKYLEALRSGSIDNRIPLDDARRRFFEAQVQDFDSQNSPDSIPETFSEAKCNVFGHICPVFFTAESMTETEEARRIGRRSLSFITMMRIVRRDNYRCQHCKKQLDDTEVEFDHKIPISKGGSSEEHNMRLTCFTCNRDKGNDYDP